MQLEDINSTILPIKNIDLSGGEKEDDFLFGKAKVKRYEQDTELRSSLTILFTLTINAWLFAVFIILLTNSKTLKLSDSVLITLLTTTTIQVLGMMIIILWDLFPGGKDKNSPSKNTE
jgi:hypothetical protein